MRTKLFAASLAALVVGALAVGPAGASAGTVVFWGQSGGAVPPGTAVKLITGNFTTTSGWWVMDCPYIELDGFLEQNSADPAEIVTATGNSGVCPFNGFPTGSITDIEVPGGIDVSSGGGGTMPIEYTINVKTESGEKHCYGEGELDVSWNPVLLEQSEGEPAELSVEGIADQHGSAGCPVQMQITADFEVHRSLEMEPVERLLLAEGP